MTSLRFGAPVLGAVLLFVAPAFAGPQEEITTAATHAGMAAGADTTKTLHFHIQHTLNCLEGKSGADFSGGVGNPCDEQGQGAIPDTPAGLHPALMEVVSKAKMARDEQDFEKGKAYAGEVQTLLGKIDLKGK
jgi:hypothetical protein